jgi:hypothetical protein
MNRMSIDLLSKSGMDRTARRTKRIREFTSPLTIGASLCSKFSRYKTSIVISNTLDGEVVPSS